MPVEESAIQLVPVPDHLRPDGREPAPATALHGLVPVKPLPAEHRPGTQGPFAREATLAPEQGPALPRRFAILLAEVLAGMRPERQVTPWLSKRATIHLHRLLPLFRTGHQPRVLRVLTARPTPEVVEMTMIAAIGPRPRAIAIRLEYTAQQARWQCTDIESA